MTYPINYIKAEIKAFQEYAALGHAAAVAAMRKGNIKRALVKQDCVRMYSRKIEKLIGVLLAA